MSWHWKNKIKEAAGSHNAVCNTGLCFTSTYMDCVLHKMLKL